MRSHMCRYTNSNMTLFSGDTGRYNAVIKVSIYYTSHMCIVAQVVVIIDFIYLYRTIMHSYAFNYPLYTFTS